MKKSSWVFAVAFLMTVAAVGQARHETTEEILRRGEIVAGNAQTALTLHLSEDADFHPSKQEPEEHLHSANILAYKDGSIELDWTPGQQARYLMEEMRQGVHELHSAGQARGLDAVVFEGVNETWPSLRDIACKEFPGAQYYDLEGFQQFCTGNRER